VPLTPRYHHQVPGRQRPRPLVAFQFQQASAAIHDGTVISQVAEARPDQVKTLVYVAAYLLKNGESLYGTSQTDAESTLGKSLVPIDSGHAPYLSHPDDLTSILLQQ